MKLKSYDYESLKNNLQKQLDEAINNPIINRGLNIDEYNKKQYQKEDLVKMQRRCGTGDFKAKIFMKDFIMELIIKLGINESNIDESLAFSDPDVILKFDILLYKYKQKYGYDALDRLIRDNDLNRMRKNKKFEITDEDISNIYMNEDKKLDFKDKLEILVQRIYQDLKGLSCVDEIMDMNINGISLGVSGIDEAHLSRLFEMELKGISVSSFKMSYESIWLYFDRTEIDLSFLKFKSYSDFQRICNIIYRFDSPGQLSKSNGCIVNSMADGSRVVVFRPDLSESWAVIVRKYNKVGDLEDIKGKNSELVRELLDISVKARQKIIITGPQGKGKTTLLIALSRRIYPYVTIRVWEDFFETYLRFKMPEHNVLTLRETDKIKGDLGVDIIKKTNGQVTLIPEAAKNEHMLALAKLNEADSDFYISTHHANSFEGLIKSGRNSLLNSGKFRNEEIAEDQMIRMVDLNIHVDFDIETKESYLRITENVINDEEEECFDEDIFNTGSLEECFKAFMGNITKYMNRKNIKKYKGIDIIVYDKQKGYIVKNKISENRKKRMYEKLLKEDKVRFEQIIKKYNL